MSDIFREGGPHQVRKTAPDQYELSVRIPTDEVGMTGRECPSGICSPGYFKVKPGTGITGHQTVAYCPYCRTCGEPSDFSTEAQLEYAKKVAINEAIGGVNDMVRQALGLDARGKKTIGGGLFSIEMSLDPARPSFVGRPVEEELRRDVICPQCGLQHAVFGLAVWCPDCGADLFMEHVRAELWIVRRILEVVPLRQEQLGARIAARDVENALEDLVSIFEAVLKAVCRLHLKARGRSDEQIATVLESRVRNRFQSVALAREAYQEVVGGELYGEEQATTISALTEMFEKRHPITHNLGVVDRKYMKRVEAGALPGREVRISATDVMHGTEIVERVLAHAYRTATSQNGDQDAAP
jgi:hypothetical protein